MEEQSKRSDKHLKCRRCGRVLKSLKSIQLGFGATCLKKAGLVISRKSKLAAFREVHTDIKKWV